MLFRQYFESSRNRSNNKSRPYASGSRNTGGESSTPMDTLSPTGKAAAVGKWNRLDDENSSTRHIIHNGAASSENGSLSDLEKNSHRV